MSPSGRAGKPSMGRRPRVGGEEQDAFSRFWRSVTIYLQRPGATAQVKAKASRRARRVAKHKLRRGDEL